ncbi:hypothetical protein FA09DRAFT_151727 [Tilletiopsis washingtonensis]|uniref:DUF1365-domain-containing protein n=1 Tax=Tilletiopsis washingtonensis TaxID=58919 RepID=A0A316Z2K1_9BASI|nr:hypothetical protein FA09DRAFT_151727 [Tilletiopsis washingtonensis]PWN95142.1 hypothetical protein FA09DRAFT_151727 [Tilletiopsis washingtonensis]
MGNGTASVGAAAAAAHTSSWLRTLALDVAVPALLLLLSVPSLLSLLPRRKGARHTRVTAATPASAYLSSARVAHARFIPAPHAFAYPALYGLFDLAALERGLCDAASAFVWRGVRPRGAAAATRWPFLTGIQPRSHLHLALPQLPSSSRTLVEGSIRAKLAYELRERGYLLAGPQDGVSYAEWSAGLGETWMVCMPALLGMQGINPLTIYYVHRPSPTPGERGAFWLAVLEVHNTFAERHVYVLEAGVEEDALKSGASRHRGHFEHAWTFERAFHVSPFNDRGGWYRLLLRPLWADDAATPHIDVRLLLLVAPADDASPDAPLRKKLFASLTSTVVSPLTTRSLLSSLARQPFDLLLPLARILKEAATLHFKKRLSVFPRPDPRAPGGSESVPNDVQAARAGRAPERGAVGWQLLSDFDEAARARLEAFAKLRAAEDDGVGFKLSSPDPLARSIDVAPRRAEAGSTAIHSLSPVFFADVLLLPPALAEQLGADTARRWSRSGPSLASYFSSSSTAQAGGWRTRAARSIRRRHVLWLLSFASPDVRASTLAQLEAPHPLDVVGGQELSLMLLRGMLSAHLAARIEETAVRSLGVHYVSGTEGWLELKRASERMGGEWDEKLGSVLLPLPKHAR